jgi:hypothetical protein
MHVKLKEATDPRELRKPPLISAREAYGLP